jgi:hypothetical protein
MDTVQLKENILRRLLYYDTFSHPLKKDEVFTFLLQNSLPKTQVLDLLNEFSIDDACRFGQRKGYVYIKPNHQFIELRQGKEQYSRKAWRTAGFVPYTIKRFPFAGIVLISGNLSKNSSDKQSDIDFMIVNAERRL